MKKIILTLALAAIATSAFAQISVGGGYLSSTKTSGNTSATGQGFYAGVDYNIQLGTSGLGVAPGVFYSSITDASATSLIGGLASIEGKTVEQFINVPVNFNYGLNFVDGALKLSLYAGPTLNYCISSKTTYSGNIAGVSGSTDPINNFEADKDYKPLNVLVGGGVALDIVETIRVNFGYNYGLMDLHANENIELKRAGWHVGLALVF